MEKSKKTKIIKLVSATSMAVFSLFVSISGAFAWFAGVRNVNGDGDNFYVQSVDSSIVGVTLHEFYGESDTDLLPVTTEIDHSTGNAIPTYNLPVNTRYIHVSTTATATNNLIFTVNKGGANESICTLASAIDIDSKPLSAGATDFIIDVCYSELITEEDLGNAHTLDVSYTNSSNDFSITIAKYEIPCFTFNPTGISIYDGESFNVSALVKLNPYFIERPHHPVLIMYKVNGYRTRIDLETDYCYLGSDTDFIVSKYRSRDALFAAESADELVADSYYEVINDEAHSNKATLYRMDESLSYVTYDSFADINVDSIKVNANDGRYFRVQEDEEHGGVASIYQYHKATKSFEVVWLDLGDSDYSKTNPLSSVVDFYYIEYEENTIPEMATTKYVARETFNDAIESYSYEKGYLSCIAIPQKDLNEDNMSSFTNFSDAETYDYQKSISIYDRDTTNYSYVGIVVDYDQLALEYIFSQNIGHDALNSGLVFKCDWITKF